MKYSNDFLVLFVMILKIYEKIQFYSHTNYKFSILSSPENPGSVIQKIRENLLSCGEWAR